MRFIREFGGRGGLEAPGLIVADDALFQPVARAETARGRLGRQSPAKRRIRSLGRGEMELIAAVPGQRASQGNGEFANMLTQGRHHRFGFFAGHLDQHGKA
jgi:hypothetical protein